MCLNLEHETRELVVQVRMFAHFFFFFFMAIFHIFLKKAFAVGDISENVFDSVLFAVTHQMQQNLYFQFIAHLKVAYNFLGFFLFFPNFFAQAIRQQLATQDKLARLSGRTEVPIWIDLFFRR